MTLIRIGLVNLDKQNDPRTSKRINYKDPRLGVGRPVLDTSESTCVIIKRHGHVDDIANAVIFLGSDESGFITGQILNVDGGAVAHV